METIEKRALRLYPISNIYDDQTMSVLDLNEQDRDLYIEGAKDQQEIDDAFLHERFEKVLNGQKWDLIDKACEWIEANMEKFTWDDYENDPKGMAEAFKNFMGGVTHYEHED